ncbi:hypothetical protein CBR_g26494 [Chara braunii]|uniref:Uncharacterized protein n=1 Tax=Chara braunii TaxID=69332 RepID=A0A388L857_CHABU|nr:hypothetical protein CBR_g26494 [Chara braunii]|eukprot:GBG78464.1 hypothetical protein CBR_g26494 [Chara braunii]
MAVKAPTAPKHVGKYVGQAPAKSASLMGMEEYEKLRREVEELKARRRNQQFPRESERSHTFDHGLDGADARCGVPPFPDQLAAGTTEKGGHVDTLQALCALHEEEKKVDRLPCLSFFHLASCLMSFPGLQPPSTTTAFRREHGLWLGSSKALEARMVEMKRSIAAGQEQLKKMREAFAKDRKALEDKVGSLMAELAASDRQHVEECNALRRQVEEQLQKQKEIHVQEKQQLEEEWNRRCAEIVKEYEGAFSELKVKNLERYRKIAESEHELSQLYTNVCGANEELRAEAAKIKQEWDCQVQQLQRDHEKATQVLEDKVAKLTHENQSLRLERTESLAILMQGHSKQVEELRREKEKELLHARTVMECSVAEKDATIEELRAMVERMQLRMNETTHVLERQHADLLTMDI